MAAPKCPATQALQKKILAAAGTCNACRPQVEYLEGIAATCPELVPTMEELRVFLESLQATVDVGSVGIQDSSGQGNGNATA